MEEQDHRSCWGLTVKAALGFAGLIFLAWLLGGTDAAVIVAAS